MDLVYRASAAFFAMMVPEHAAVGNSCLEHGAMGLFASSATSARSCRHACSAANDISSGCTRERRLGSGRNGFAAARRRFPVPGSQQQAQSRSPAWLESQRVARLDGRPQTPDLVPPSRDEAVELGFLAVVPHAALAER